MLVSLHTPVEEQESDAAAAGEQLPTVAPQQVLQLLQSITMTIVITRVDCIPICLSILSTHGTSA